ncbi:hypothetical protein ABIE04_002637 [Rhodanobacter soli]|uniref:50S ribosomal protein L32 n=1 Tax=Rhodanobacter soli TaxID=590609 RepID=A0ABV2PZ15_9GAMM
MAVPVPRALRAGNRSRGKKQPGFMKARLKHSAGES